MMKVIHNEVSGTLQITIEVRDPRPDGLSEEEWVALNLISHFANSYHRCCHAFSSMQPHKDCADNDWNEATVHIHSLQNALLAQIAARRNPTLFRGLGRVFGFDRAGRLDQVSETP